LRRFRPEVGGVRLAFEGVVFDTSDDGAGPAIVLLHDLAQAKEAWDAQAAALAESARVVRFDLRGMGRSSTPPGPYLMEQLAGDVAAVLDALDVERALIAGHGAGGYVTFAFFRMFAERCRALALISTRGAADAAVRVAERLALADRVDREGVAPLLASEADVRARDFIAATDPAGAAAMLRGIALRSASDDLYDEIDVPVRVVAGVDDPELAASRALAAGVAGARFVLLDCGRFPLWQAPEALTASLEELLHTTEAT